MVGAELFATGNEIEGGGSSSPGGATYMSLNLDTLKGNSYSTQRLVEVSKGGLAQICFD